MPDLKRPSLMYLKAVLLAGIAALCALFILVESPSWRTAVLLGLVVWASCRVYYFLFYVITRYIDPTARVSGLLDALCYLRRKRRNRPDARPSDLPPPPGDRPQ